MYHSGWCKDYPNLTELTELGISRKTNFLFNRDETLGAGVTDTSSNNPNAKKVLENQEGCGFRASEGTRFEF